MMRRSTIGLVYLVSVLCAGDVRTEEPPETERLTDLVRELGHPDVNNRRLAAYALEHFDYTDKRLDTNEAVAALSKALEDGDRQVWAHSVRALARLGPAAAAAVPTLMRDLGERSQRGYRTAYALGCIGAAAVPPLVGALRNDSTERKIDAARALGWSGAAAAPAIPALIEALVSDIPELRQLASDALAGIGASAVPPLVAALESEPASVRSGAARALGGMGTGASAALDRLAELVDDPDSAVRANVVTALRHIGMSPPDLVPVLADKLRDEAEEVRIAALNSLLKMRPIERYVVPVLTAALESDRREAVHAAAIAMKRVASPASVPALVNALLRCRLDEAAIIDALAEAIGRAGPGSAPVVIASFDDERATGARYDGLARALTTIGTAVVPALLEALDHDSGKVRAGATESLGNVGTRHGFGGSERRAVRALAGALDDDTVEVRLRAAQALGQLGQLAKPAVRQLMRTAREDEADVRSAALLALSSVGVTADQLLPLLTTAIDSDASSLRLAAVSAALDLDSEMTAVTPGLVRCLDDRSSEVRAGAARALGQAARPSKMVIQALVKALQDQDPSVRLAAIESCGRIGPEAEPAVAALVRVMTSEATSPEATSPEAEETCLAAARALGNIGRAAAAARPALEQALQRGSVKLRGQAATSLGRITADPPRIVPVLVKALESDDASEVRRAVVEVLGSIGPDAQDAVPALFQMMNRRYESRIAYEALKQIKPRSVPILRDALHHRSGFVKSLAAESLGDLGAQAEAAVPDLRDALNEPRLDRRLERRLRDALEDIQAAVEARDKEARKPSKLRVF